MEKHSTEEDTRNLSEESENQNRNNSEEELFENVEVLPESDAIPLMSIPSNMSVYASGIRAMTSVRFH